MKSLLYVLGASLLISCGGNNSTTEEKNTAVESTAMEETTADEDKMTEDISSDTIQLTIEANDLMQFNTDRLEVNEGQVVVLTLNHTGEMSVETMGHNWVLLTNGTDKSAFGGAAISAKKTDYIPASMIENVIANTGLVGGGQSTTITFSAPEKGTYDFLCSFPGHYGVMQGKFVVK